MSLLLQLVLVLQVIACLCFCGVVLVAWSVYLNKIRNSKSFSKLNGRHVMITGGSSGIGLSLAKIAVNHGASVSLFARDEKKLREAKDFLEKSRKLQTSKIFTYSVDVSSGFEAVKSAVAQAEEALGNTYMLINCAGYCFSEVFEKIPMEQFERMMSVNYLGSVYFSRAVVQKMKAEGMGSITFVSSQAGIMGLYGFTGYSASKFALRGLAESLYMELKPYGVGVTFSMPPDTDTPGLVAENVTKPAATKEISAGSGLSSPEQVADKILKDAVGGVFLSCHGLEGHLLGILCSGMAPALSVIEHLGQACCIGIIRLSTLFFRLKFDSIVGKYCAEDSKEKTKQKNL